MQQQHRTVGQSLKHESAHLHVSGKANYTDDIPQREGTLHAAIGISTRAHAKIKAMDLSAVKAAEGVIAVITLDDVPGDKYLGPFLHDEPIFADEEVLYYGQPVFAVAATSHDLARRAAKLAKIEYEDLPAILTAQAAAEAKAYVLPPVHIKRGNVEEKLANAKHRVTGVFDLGGQEQFYLEGQIAYALPGEDGDMHVYTSTQHPSEMQFMVAHALGQHVHTVKAECRRMGGGFGGKETQSWVFAVIAALLARKTGKPVKLRADRDDDMMITGKRHDFQILYDIAHDDDGRIQGLKIEYRLRCGFSADLSGPVGDRAIFHTDNAYYLDEFDILSIRGKTNTQSNTAFRGFGGPQGIIAIEYMIDTIARKLGKDPLDVRKINFYGKTDRNVTPYQMTVEDNVIHELVAELEETSEYRKRRQEVNEFNAKNKILKKGLALVPVKFGISFTATQFNQAGALLHVYTDGSVMINHGGTEMGQGLNTKVAQVVAEELGLSIDRVRVSATDTSKVPNTSATAASTGTDLNGKAAQDACVKVKEKLAAFAAERYGCKPEEVRFADNHVYAGNEKIAFEEFVKIAYTARVPLWSSGFYRTPKIHYDFKTLTGRPFFYFAYGASVSEVIIDTLTGESRLLRADVLHDVGSSLNPAIDIGQVEGGFIQGAGWLTTEELWWNKDGKLMTHAPSTYKIPSVSDVPAQFNTRLYANSNKEDSIYHSKAVGEPPLPLGMSVFLALRDAVAAVDDSGRAVPPLMAPATAEAILKAVEAVKAAKKAEAVEAETV
ncbi:xanthine dehydrogenase molybdenum binding subunit apoprotein [Crenobacter luteus]|uniref:Aldehyde oxidase n=1 Tax=Crenobacter luteus TaxID=1452487 RepID=A0A163CUH3_9NEIS|nr:xanthine dehydrogenase molybdopterin binding subunit [Crenobacter luteus]KZE33201.1 aldehyde oxidase [Crenobacter luteus]TCP15707.1 xanthine dehydrogenase molybdenum binding subunit apoprotein [Crenobacter luteus]